MISKKPQAELTVLQEQQEKARQDEVFLGMSKAERAEFNRRAERIHALDTCEDKISG